MNINITILKSLGEVGIINECKSFISDSTITVNVEGASDGSLTIGQRTFAVKGGKAKLWEYEILAGDSKVTFICDGKEYACGSITRNGRFLKVNTNTDKLIVSCVLKYEAQSAEIEKLKKELKTVKDQYGINLV